MNTSVSEIVSEPPVRARLPDVRFMLSHPAHWLALGFGSGLSPVAPGTVGTLWAWLSFAVLDVWLGDLQWALLLAASLPVGWWACTLTARHLRQADPGSIVWDEIVCFWAVLWLVTPSGGAGGWSVLWTQLAAFGWFRFFDAAKLHSLVADHLSGRRDNSAPLWSLLMFDAFLAHVGKPVAP